LGGCRFAIELHPASLMAASRRIVRSNLKSASAHLIASAIGDVPLN
jgi:hypothetical protein